MKTTGKITTLLIVAILTISSANALAQRGRGMKGMSMPGERMQRFQQACTQMIPDLTEEQKTQIQELRVEQMKQMTTFRNQLMEKRARLRTLETQDKPDMNAINSVIEDMGEIRTNMQKNRAEHRQEVREILTDEQRVFYDNRMMHRRGKFSGRRGGAYPGHGMRPGMRPGMQPGRGLQR